MTDDLYPDDAECEACGNDWAWHKAVKPRHEFVPLGDDPTLKAAKPAAGSGETPRRDPAVVSQMLQQHADPVLRALLIDKGLFRPEELTRMEQRMATNLAASGAVVVGDSSQEDTNADGAEGS